MEKTTICADYNVACELMDSLYTLYMTIVEGMGGNPNDPNLHQEGENYARKKFVKLANEFENAFPIQWAWVSNEEDDE